MNSIIKINIGQHQLKAEIFDTPTGRAILAVLPFEARANTWGDEIYFGVNAKADLEADAIDVVAVGDLAYWPSMPAFCIFFGPTPVSHSDEPRAASAVNVFGKLIDPDLVELRSIRDRANIHVSNQS